MDGEIVISGTAGGDSCPNDGFGCASGREAMPGRTWLPIGSASMAGLDSGLRPGRLIVAIPTGAVLPPILLRLRSSGGATRVSLLAERCAAADADARAYVEVEASPQNECARRGAPGRRNGRDAMLPGASTGEEGPDRVWALPGDVEGYGVGRTVCSVWCRLTSGRSAWGGARNGEVLRLLLRLRQDAPPGMAIVLLDMSSAQPRVAEALLSRDEGVSQRRGRRLIHR